jgi:hypothetical protein
MIVLLIDAQSRNSEEKTHHQVHAQVRTPKPPVTAALLLPPSDEIGRWSITGGLLVGTGTFKPEGVMRLQGA